MKADLELYITDVEVIMNRDGSALLLRAQLVDQPASGPVKSGKYVHLTMRRGQAELLRGQLHGLLGGEPLQGEKTWVPPEKDRN